MRGMKRMRGEDVAREMERVARASAMRRAGALAASARVAAEAYLPREGLGVVGGAHGHVQGVTQPHRQVEQAGG